MVTMASTTRSGKALALAIFALAACGGRAVDRPRNTTETPSGGSSSEAGSAAMPDGPVAGTGAAAGTASGGVSASGGASSVGGTPSGGEATEAGAGGEPSGPHPYRALQIATGSFQTCALLEDHRVKCWGRSAYGALGLGDMKDRGALATDMGDALPFVDLGTGHTAKSIAAGRYTTCAILDDDSVKCWGLTLFVAAGNGTLGDEPNEMGDALEPLPLGDGRTAKQVALGYYDSCILLDDDSYYCGGTSGGGGKHIDAINEAKPLTLFTTHTVLAKYDDGRLCGVSNRGLDLATPDRDVRLVSGGEGIHCYLHSDDALDCSFREAPTLLPGAVDISVTQSSPLKTLCATDSKGGVKCWGDVEQAPWAPNAIGPVQVPLSRPAVQLKAGNDFHCALLDDGSVVCWPWATDPAPPAIGNPNSDLSHLSAVDLGTFPGDAKP